MTNKKKTHSLILTKGQIKDILNIMIEDKCNCVFLYGHQIAYNKNHAKGKRHLFITHCDIIENDSERTI